MDREALYQRLPLSLQNWATTLEGWRIQRQRYPHEFRRILEDAREREFWDRPRTFRFRDERLRAYVAHLAATAPHYVELFRGLGVRPEEIRGLSDLQALPILTRVEIQDRVERFVSNAVPKRATLACHTSGSTGSGLQFPATLTSYREQWAIWWRYRISHGIVPGTWMLAMGGRSVVPLAQKKPPFWRYNRAGRQTLFSAYHLNAETAGDYLDEMRRSGATWLHGYPSMVALLAGFALERGVELGLRVVTFGAENVLPQQVERIREAFRVEPLQHYGMAEGAANASQCSAGSLHVDEDFAAVEFVPLSGDQYRIVGTSFANAALGLVRYDVGDVATLNGRECSCGRPGRVLDAIDGRREDYVVTRSGARLGRLDHVFKDLKHIREAQIRQSEPGRMSVWIVRGNGYADADEAELRREVQKRVGHEVEFDVQYCDELPRSSRGKLRFVVSTLESGKLV